MNGQTITIVGSGNACSDSTLTDANFSITSTGEFVYWIGATDANGNETNTSSRQLTIEFGGSGGLIPSGGGSTTTTDSSDDTSSGDLSVSFSDDTTELKQTNFASRILERIINFFKNLF